MKKLLLRSPGLALASALSLCACKEPGTAGSPPPELPPKSPAPRAAATAPEAPAPSPQPRAPGPLDDRKTPVRPPNTSERGSVSGAFGVVTSVEEQATRAGVRILEAGGNAVDAAVATAFVLAVTHPSAGNLGGGGFLLLRMKERVVALDFREDSPRALTLELFRKMIARGAADGAAVGVPGTTAGLHTIHRDYGKLPWAQVIAPAESLAREGYRLGARQSQVIGWARSALQRDPVARELFLPGGRVPPPKARLKNERLALLLRRIAEGGPAGFYAGETARDLVKSLGQFGLIDEEDLARYEARYRDPLSFDFLGYRVVTMPPPSGGGVVLTQSLLALQELHAEELEPSSVARAHLVAEANRRAQVERRLIVVAPETLSPSERDEQRRRWLDPSAWLRPHPIDLERRTPSSALHPLYAEAARELEHTTHLSVIDAAGDAVSCTLTLSGSFGARVVTRETGVVLNNSVASFSSVGANTAAPARRTISSMAPTLVFAGERGLWALGTPGGDTIPSTLTQLVLALTADEATLTDAVALPRFHQGFVPDVLGTERQHPLPEPLVAGLRKLGHVVRPSRLTQGDANVAAWFDGRAWAVSDGREGGLAAGAAEIKPPGGPVAP